MASSINTIFSLPRPIFHVVRGRSGLGEGKMVFKGEAIYYGPLRSI